VLSIEGITGIGAISRSGGLQGAPGTRGSPGGFQAVFDEVVTRGKAEALAAQAEERKALEEVAASFEAFFLYQLLQSMRRTIPKGGLIDTGFAGEMYTGMLDDALSQQMAKAGGIGLGKILLDQLA